MAHCFILLLVIPTLVIQLVRTNPVREDDTTQPALDNSSNSSSSHFLHGTVSRGEELAFEGIVHFERFLSEEKANLLSTSLYVEDPEALMPTGSDDNRRTVQCLSHINYLNQAARRRLSWALDMIDSSGKPSPGVLRKNRLFVGDFDQCIDVDTGLDFEGQYCMTRVLISKIRNTTLTPQLQFQLGLCFPSSCEPEDVENVINSYFQSNVDISVTAQQTNCQERHLPLTTKAKWIISICSLFVLFIVSGTLYDVLYTRWWAEEGKRQNPSEDQNSSTSIGSDKSPSEKEPIVDPKLTKPKLYSSKETAQTQKLSTHYDFFDKLLLSFSVYSNTAKLFHVATSRDSIGCIHGIRFISMTWIILIHTYNMGGLALGERLT